MRIPKISKMASNEIEEGPATKRVPQEETDYNSVSDVPISVLKVLMRIEKVNGDPPRILNESTTVKYILCSVCRGTTISHRAVEFL